MIPNSMDKKIDIQPTQCYAKCPVCNRREKFNANKKALAQAWLTEHINIEHRDELPRYKNE